MNVWIPVAYESLDPGTLPKHWEVMRDPRTGDLAVVGCAKPGGAEAIDVVVRLDYASVRPARGFGYADVRIGLAHTIAHLLDGVTRLGDRSSAEHDSEGGPS